MLFADMGARIVRVDPAGPAYGAIGGGPPATVGGGGGGGLGPPPLLPFLFADRGARIVRVDPAGPAYGAIGSHLWIFRGQESVTLDLRQPRGQGLLLALVEQAD